ncbi:hypothetical protein [Spirochaeta cellobiosiphila]|uniref:hypothetical protein n=1 Tax=Spirochaeta cellobiosiphila TaxID=504483 RepID=UPI00041E10DE|nr:hypothetical protein [Spirochaeta cellobiosiphila]
MKTLKCDMTGKEITPSLGKTLIREIDFFTIKNKVLSREGMDKLDEIARASLAQMGHGKYSLKAYKEIIAKALDKYC